MSWKNDGNGFVFKPLECKIYNNNATWGMKLSQIGVNSFPDFVGIATFSFQLEYAATQLKRLPSSMKFVCNSKFADKAQNLKTLVPESKIYVHPKVHQKLILIPDKTIYLGSLNMVNQYQTRNNESTIGVRSKEAYDWAFNNLWLNLIEGSDEII